MAGGTFEDAGDLGLDPLLGLLLLMKRRVPGAVAEMIGDPATVCVVDRR